MFAAGNKQHMASTRVIAGINHGIVGVRAARCIKATEAFVGSLREPFNIKPPTLTAAAKLFSNSALAQPTTPVDTKQAFIK